MDDDGNDNVIDFNSAKDKKVESEMAKQEEINKALIAAVEAKRGDMYVQAQLESWKAFYLFQALQERGFEKQFVIQAVVRSLSGNIP